MDNDTEANPGVINDTTMIFLRAVSLTAEYQSISVLYKAWLPCLLVLGGFGNVAIIFVLHRSKDHNSSQHVFLTALAVADLSCLYFNVFYLILNYYHHVDMSALHTLTCKLNSWLGAASFRSSTWLVVAVTVQRTLAVKWPHRIRVMCTVRRTWIVVAALVLAACAVYIYKLVMDRVENKVCTYHRTAANDFFIRYVNTWLHLTLGSFLPFLCLLVCDIILSLSLFQSTSAISVTNQAVSNDPSVQSDNSRRETAKRTTVMILALSISFLILTLPVEIIVMWVNFRFEMVTQRPRLYATMLLLMNVGRLLVTTNSAINFFLYCFTGTKFRREFLNWVCCRAVNPSSRAARKTASGLS